MGWFVMFTMWYIAVSYIWACNVRRIYGNGPLGFTVFVMPLIVFSALLVLSRS